MRKTLLASVVMLLTTTSVPTSLSAQWTTTDKAVPRAKDGTPVLTGPAPRRPDGKPDLSGVWTADPPRFRDMTLAMVPGATLTMTPSAEAIFNQRKTGALSRLEPDANCLSQGVPKINMTPPPFKIVQQPDLVVMLYEAFGQFRQIFMDGRDLPADPNPQWLGYSVAAWEGDTLVVRSSGFNGLAWLDQLGHPSTEALRVTERFRRTDFGHMELQATVDDPMAYTRPWTVTQPLRLMVDTDLIEMVCNENNKNLGRLPGR